MADRDYHELTDEATAKRLAQKAAERHAIEQSRQEIRELPQTGLDPAEVNTLNEAVTEATGPLGIAPALTQPPMPSVSYVALPDGRQQFIVELRAGDYDVLTLGDRATVLDAVLASIRASLVKMWSLPA